MQLVLPAGLLVSSLGYVHDTFVQQIRRLLCRFEVSWIDSLVINVCIFVIDCKGRESNRIDCLFASSFWRRWYEELLVLDLSIRRLLFAVEEVEVPDE